MAVIPDRRTVGARLDLNMLAFSGGPPRPLNPVLAPIQALNVEDKNYARSVEPPARRRTKSGKLTTRRTRAAFYDAQAAAGEIARRERCLRAFGRDLELDTMEIAGRLGIDRMAALQAIAGWRKIGAVEYAGKTIARVKVWRRLA